MNIIDLTGNWQLTDVASGTTYNACVPGDVHLDLSHEGEIPDPFYRDNEERQMWIGELDWLYSCRFVLSSEQIAHERLTLLCQGLDTLADVYVNDSFVGDADNMFRCWEWDIKNFVTAGENTLQIYFSSVLPEIQRRQQERFLRTGGGPVKISGGSQVRKEQCNFGWDWGPMCLTYGIWRPLYLLGWDQARLGAVHVEQKHRNEHVELAVKVRAEKTAGDTSFIAEAIISFQGQQIATQSVEIKGPGGTINTTLNEPELWWPNGLGEQNLYHVTVNLKTKRGTLLDTTHKRIGLRTLRLVQERDHWGMSFRFEVNGLSFFAKGGNWIPADVFQSRLSTSDYRHLLESCAEANMNMLRVWGGGIYEEDVFYDICDELGLCVWQDFMFACAAYPADRSEFIENVRNEAIDNIQRLRHHPSLALYCGNNELEQMGLIADDPEQEGKMRWSEYKSLFDELLPSLVQEYDPERDYIPSTEYSPEGDRQNTSADWCGDAHLWKVWHGYKPFEWYRTSYHRFCSEYGFQSHPEPKTWRSFTEPGDRNLNSYIINKHQRSADGNRKMLYYMLDWFRLPHGFENGIWLSQIQQALAVKCAVEHWRRNMPRCMGSLYWQINDCWPAPTWASMDCKGRWKALQYFAKRFYAPLLISGVEDAENGTVDLHVTNDHRQTQPCDVHWVVTGIKGQVLQGGRHTVHAAGNANTPAGTLDLQNLLTRHSKRDILVWLYLLRDGQRVSTNFVTLARPKDLPLRDPGICCNVDKVDDKTFDLTISAAHPALWLWLELPNTDARFSDNFFCVRPGETENVRVFTQDRMDEAEFNEEILMRSIYDTYQ